MKEIKYNELMFNPMNMFGEDWCLLCAGNENDGHNAMTISWGHIGIIWNRKLEKGKTSMPTINVYVRPQRYTKEFIDKENLFTVCAFDTKYKKSLGYMGSHSGRDGDKDKMANLTPVYEDGITYYKEAKIVFVCRKLFRSTLHESEFIDKSIVLENYPENDFHDMYIGEIVKVLVSEQK